MFLEGQEFKTVMSTSRMSSFSSILMIFFSYYFCLFPREFNQSAYTIGVLCLCFRWFWEKDCGLHLGFGRLLHWLSY